MPRGRLAAFVLVFLIAGAAHGQTAATAPADAPAQPKAKAKTKARREPAGYYMGRRVADVMSYLGADWLVRAEREQEEHPEQMLDSLKIAEGATVADVGAGVGYTSVRLARRVGANGTVYATDLQPQMLKLLKENATEAGAANIKPILCTPSDPKLPEGKIDLILMVDVYHECSEPVATLKGLRAALKPGGRLVLVEFRAEDPEVPIKPEHKMSLKQVRRELEPQGFAFKESLEFLPWQHVIIFEKPKDQVKKDREGKKDASQ